MKIKNIKLACAATAGSCIGIILSRSGDRCRDSADDCVHGVCADFDGGMRA